jgi:hypothetical protein
VFENHPDLQDRVDKALSFQYECGKIYSYNSRAVEQEAKEFYEQGRNAVPEFDIRYIPNPFVYQYDLEMHMFLEYERLQKKELEILAASNAPSSRIEEVQRFGFSGAKREEHLFNACAIRWPVYSNLDGSLGGHFIRHPWVEDDFHALSNYQFVISFGGAGQGKTHGYLCFLCLLWDHYIDTEKGGKCSFSTVNEDKLKNVAWPYIQRFYHGTDEDRDKYSLYAGRGQIVSDFTIKRKGKKMKDTAGVIKGILVGNNTNQSTVTDKLTGSHGHYGVAYLIDELQSTPIAPLEASANFLSTSRHGWVVCAGNYDRDSDSLGDNVRPTQGWKNVDETTHIWESTICTGATACCIHKNNDLSPAMKEPWDKLTPFLPTEKRKLERFPTESSRKTEAYRRFWIGWRSAENTEGYVITESIVHFGKADEDFSKKPVRGITNYFSFDSAPADADRNVLLTFGDGYNHDDGLWVWGFKSCETLPKATASDQYYRESSQEIIKRARILNVRSGNMITDWSNRGGHPEFLDELGFKTEVLVYNEAPPDGNRIVERLGITEPSIVAEVNQDGVPIKWAHTVCVNRISMGAFALRAYIILGVISGINRELLEPMKNMGMMNDYEQELFRRKTEQLGSVKYGDREKLEEKRIFIKEYGFSPDVLDCMFQAAYFMWAVKGMPIYEKVYLDGYSKEEPIKKTENATQSQIDEINELWNDELIEEESDIYFQPVNW